MYEERNNLVEKNLYLVKYVMNHYVYVGDDSFDDLYQEGCYALIKAADNFDESLGIKFSTYAVNCIQQSIKGYKYYHSDAYHGFIYPEKWKRNRRLYKELINSGKSKNEVFDEFKAKGIPVPYQTFISLNKVIPCGDEDTEVGDLETLDFDFTLDIESNVDIDNFKDFIDNKFSKKQQSIANAILLDIKVLGERRVFKYYADKYGTSRELVRLTLNKLGSLYNEFNSCMEVG